MNLPLHALDRLRRLMLGSLAVLALAAAAPAQSSSFRFVAADVGYTESTVTIPVVSASTGFDISVWMPQTTTGAFKLVGPTGQVWGAAEMQAAGGAYIDLVPDTAWGAPEFGFKVFVPTVGRRVTLSLPGNFAAGTYTLRTDFPAPLAGEIAYAVRWETHEALRSSGFVEPAVALIGKPVVFGFGVQQDGQAASAANVSATYKPWDGGDEIVVGLEDNGTAPDGAANEGLYVGTSTPSGAGDYAVMIRGVLPMNAGGEGDRVTFHRLRVLVPSGSIGPGPLVPRAILTPALKVDGVALDVPVHVEAAGKFHVIADLRMPTGRVLNTRKVLDLAPGDHTVTLSFPTEELGQENGVYHWDDVVLLGPASDMPMWRIDERMDPAPAENEVLVVETDWVQHPVTILPLVQWTTTDLDQDGLFDQLVAAVSVRLEFGGVYECSADMVGFCNYSTVPVNLGTAWDKKEVGPVATFYLVFEACEHWSDLMRLDQGYYGPGVGQAGPPGRLELRNLRITWRSPEPSPFPAGAYTRSNTRPVPYTSSSLECFALRRDRNGNGVIDLCDIADRTSTDSNSNGIPDEVDKPCAGAVACNPADVTSVGGDPPCPDGQLTVDDLIAFINAFSEGTGCPSSTPPCNLADISGVGGPPEPPDGELTVDDLIAFTNAFSEGCPGEPSGG